MIIVIHKDCNKVEPFYNTLCTHDTHLNNISILKQPLKLMFLKISESAGKDLNENVERCNIKMYIIPKRKTF